MADEADRKAAAASARHATVLESPDCLGSSDCDGRGGTPASFSRLTALRYEDIEGRRLILHADLCGRAKGDTNNSTGGRDGQELCSEAVQVVVEQVREMLSANPAVVAIVSEMAPPVMTAATTTAVPGEAPPLSPLGLLLPETAPSPPLHNGTDVSASSLRATAATVSSLLGMEVDFYDSIPELALALGQCGGGDGGSGGGGGGGSWATSLGAKVMMAERLGAPGVVPAPPVEEPELSDDEEERLPDFGWGGEGMIMYGVGLFVWRYLV